MPPDLRSIHSFDDLLAYLADELDWPVADHNLDELTFEYDADDLGLKEEEAEKLKGGRIRQLRPLPGGQPWGIFFVEFENKKLPVVVLRRILSNLVLKKRASSNASDAKRWAPSDLLFISAFGEEENPEIAFAHFHKDPETTELPVLRVLGWDGGDTPLKLGHVAGVLKSRLHWPEKTSDHAAWRRQWSGAFRHRLGHVIRTSNDLADALAHFARKIRDAAATIMAHESEAKGQLRQLHAAFRSALIHDLSEADFADTYAQTVTYGLLTAAISKTEMSEGRHGTALSAEDMTAMVPVTNPFLKEMLESFLQAGGRKGGMDFDELGIHEVVELLRGEETDLPAILRDFGNKTRGEDPVIHFYEHFLSAYNKKLRIQRGVFYTPQPVVSYIVRSVHELLRTEFGLEHGLADITTWGEFIQKSQINHPQSEIKLPPLTDEPGETRTISPDEPFVQILDPATGTATFPVEVIDVIHRHLKERWRPAGPEVPDNRPEFKTFTDYWNHYVPNHLLPRLHAYELMMAPYAIAHMKLGLKLAETGYRFGTEERARIYLTNALEPWMKQLPLIGFDALAHEAAAVNEIKRHKRFTVVIGNPPYSAISSNLTPSLRRIVDPYRFVNGEKIRERSMLQFEKNIQDDYVKFLALSQAHLSDAGWGICGLITNHSYLDGPTLRGVRWNLLTAFHRTWFLDLHGNSNKGEESPAGKANENVFDIKQGVAVAVLLKSPVLTADEVVKLGGLWGARTEKYQALAAQTLLATEFDPIQPKAPYYYLVPPDGSEGATEWEGWPSVSDVFGKRSTGTESGFDDLLVAYTLPELKARLARFCDPSASKGELAAEFDFPEGHAAKIFGRRLELRTMSDNEFKQFQLRAYDYRFAALRKEILKTNSFNVMLDLSEQCPGLVTTRQTKENFAAFAVKSFAGHKITSGYDRSYVFPLFTRDADSLIPTKLSCLSRQVLVHFHRLGGSAGNDDDNRLSIDVFNYALAVMNSSTYAKMFNSQLKRDFPRLPLTGSLELFRELARLGGELVALHLLESPALETPLTEFTGSSKLVTKPGWADGTVWLDAGGKKAATTPGSSGFRGVPEQVWNFHIGGYQVCEKWLKDRKGRTLSAEDITHYHKIVVALSETIRLMAEIDQVIEAHGGWPGAFQTEKA